jgi:RNA polymerase sigma-70 factor (sigma-E family)
MRADEHEAFREYVLARKATLLRTAYLLSGDWHRAEDIVSTAVVKLYTAWRKTAATANPDAYVRKIVVRLWLDESRRPWRREHPAEVLPELVVDESIADPAAYKADLRRLLDLMPARQRAVLVLRFYDDLSVEQTADVLGCSQGAVKTLTARALEAIRRLLPAGVTTRTEYEEAQ